MFRGDVKNLIGAVGGGVVFFDPHSNSMPMSETTTVTLSLRETIDRVREFHDAFGIPNASGPTAELNAADLELRHRLMHEENEEYLEAARNGDLVEVADALGDMLYILCGTILKHGLHDKIEEVFEEIQRSNMSKLDADGNPIYREDGKVLKSELYFRPDIRSILHRHEP